MKVVINPEYEYLREWIEQIPSFFEGSGEIVYKARNILKMFSLDNGLKINIKRYKKPHFFNRIVYSFFRKTKASRAYYNTLEIAEKGFDTTGSIAYIEIKQGGLLSESFFISQQCRDVKEIREFHSGPLSGNENLIKAFVRYSARLHDAGVYHLDYSPGNILYHNNNGEYSFIPVDVNRMAFRPVSYDDGCRNFARLFVDDDINRYIGEVYSESRRNTLGKDETAKLIIKYKDDFWKRKARQRRIKDFFRL